MLANLLLYILRAEQLAFILVINSFKELGVLLDSRLIGYTTCRVHMSLFTKEKLIADIGLVDCLPEHYGLFLVKSEAHCL